MKLLALTIGQDTVASSRVRAASVLITATENRWQTCRITSENMMWPVLLVAAIFLWRPHVLLIQKIAPPRIFSVFLAKISKRIVFELDDAIYLGYPGEEAAAGATTKRLQTLLARVDRITVSNRLIANDLSPYSPHSIAVFPGPAPAIAPPHTGDRHRDRILWLGSPSTIGNLRRIVYPAIPALPQFKFNVLGAAEEASPFHNLNEIVWTMDAQLLALRESCIGLMPLEISPWNERKAGYKILEYLANNVVPVATENQALVDLLEDDLEALIVKVPNQSVASWISAIQSSENRRADESWRRARDRVFERLSIRNYSETVLGVNFNDGEDK